MSNLPTTVNTTAVTTGVDNFTTSLTTYLTDLNLPANGVLVGNDQRYTVIDNFPKVIGGIDSVRRADSLYLSKFIAACGAGLFDAALNFLWNETVVNLRWKVSLNDIDYFYDSIVTDTKRRDKLKTVDDLVNIEEWELVKGCHLTGLLSDIGFKHLDYIRDMRNWASAAHPNQSQLTGFMLISWLETCIKEVIAKEPEPSALQIKRVLSNIRGAILDGDDLAHIKSAMESLPQDVVDSFLRTIFGMYTNDNAAVQVKNNIKGIAKKCWDLSSETTKYSCGIRYQSFAANGERVRKDAANEFLTTVSGLPYLPSDSLAVEISIRVTNLYQAHFGWNNFHNEPAHASSLAAYISSAGNVPDSVRFEYVKTIVLCYLGNSYGVSNMAVSYYEEMIGKFGEAELKEFVKIIYDKDVISRLATQTCASRYKHIASHFVSRTTNQITSQALNAIIASTDPQLPNLSKATAYDKLIRSY
ncbi:hypothetical protein [Enterobacter mori]